MSIATVPSTTFSEVLLASDFSEESDRALTYAKSIVRGSGGELLLVHVAQLAPVLALPEGVWVDDLSEFEQRSRRRKRPPLLCVREGLKVKAFCPFGSVGQRIAQTAEIHHADLVIIGTHGRRWPQSPDLWLVCRRNRWFSRNSASDCRPAGAPCPSSSLEAAPGSSAQFPFRQAMPGLWHSPIYWPEIWAPRWRL